MRTANVRRLLFFFFPIQFAACTGILVGVIHQTEGRGFDERAGLTTDVM